MMIPDFIFAEQRYFVDKNKLCLAIGKNVEAIRHERNLTQEQLSSLTGLSRSQIANLEAGKTSSSLEAIYTIAYALHKEVKDILP